MKISVMREFVRLAENRNFSRTADEFFIAQPVLSRHIAALEDELQVKLISRSRNSFELTRAGQIVLKDFRKILAVYDGTLSKLFDLDFEKEGVLRLGVLYYDRGFYVSKIRDALKQRFPKMELILKSYQPAELENDLLNGKLDAAIIYGVSDSDRRDITYQPFMRIPYTLIYDKGHRFCDFDSFSMADLNGEKLIVPDKPFEINNVAAHFNKLLERFDVHFDETIPVSNYDEVPWILRDTGAVYISPMANPAAYGDTTEHRLLMPDSCGCDVSAVWMTENDNPMIPLLSNTLKLIYSL